MESPVSDGAETNASASQSLVGVKPAEPERSVWRRRRVLWPAAGLVVVFLAMGACWSWIAPYLRLMAAQWNVRDANSKVVAGNLPAALVELDEAVAWAPEHPAVYYQRAHVRFKLHDMPGSLDDFNKVIGINPYFADAYAGRGGVQQRLGEHRKAIDDLTKVIELRPETDPEPWNSRAYARALAGFELKEGLADVERAILLAGQDQPHILDTRGYLLHLSGQQEPALANLNKAIKLAEAQHRQALAQSLPPAAIRSLDRALAVMHHHRGLVQGSLGQSAAAAADLKKGKDLGYDPAKGVY